MTKRILETVRRRLTVVNQRTTRQARLLSSDREQPAECDIEPVQAAETLLRKYGPRAVTLLTNSRVLDDGRVLPPRLSANDCYVALEEACRKMARVAVRKYQSETPLRRLGFADALDAIFPDPVAYLTRCIRSVVSDTERVTRREIPTISLDAPISAATSDGAIRLGDTLANADTNAQPEEALLERDERRQFRKALTGALASIPPNYLAALQRDMARDRERENGAKLAPESDKERQTICRARAALSDILKRECGLDNPFVRLLAQQRSSRVRQKTAAASPKGWNAQRQDDLFRRPDEHVLAGTRRRVRPPGGQCRRSGRQRNEPGPQRRAAVA